MDFTEQLLREVAHAALGTRRVSYQGYDDRPVAAVRAADDAPRRSAQYHPQLPRRTSSTKPDYLAAPNARRGADVARHSRPTARRAAAGAVRGTTESKLIAADLHHRLSDSRSRRSRAQRYPNPAITERFELFIAGREIANGFSELNDPEDQAARFRAQVSGARKPATRRRCTSTPTTSARSSTGCRPPAGCGIGIDRLVMLLTDSPSRSAT